MLKTRTSDIIGGDTGKADRIIRRGELRGRTGLCVAQIYNLIRDGRFPKPIPLGARSVGWLERDIAVWQAGRIAERNEGEAA